MHSAGASARERMCRRGRLSPRVPVPLARLVRRARECAALHCGRWLRAAVGPLRCACAVSASRRVAVRGRASRCADRWIRCAMASIMPYFWSSVISVIRPKSRITSRPSGVRSMLPVAPRRRQTGRVRGRGRESQSHTAQRMRSRATRRSPPPSLQAYKAHPLNHARACERITRIAAPRPAWRAPGCGSAWKKPESSSCVR